MHAGHGIEKVRIARTSAAESAPSPRKLAWGVTAGAAALAMVLASAVPVKAGERGDDLAKALIAALVVGAIIHETKKDKRSAPPIVLPANPPEPVHKKKKKHDRSPRVPAVCALTFEGERRDVTVYPESCLLDEGVTHRLPRYCAKEARIYGEWDRIYGEKCLREAGFRLPEDRYGH